MKGYGLLKHIPGHFLCPECKYENFPRFFTLFPRSPAAPWVLLHKKRCAQTKSWIRHCSEERKSDHVIENLASFFVISLVTNSTILQLPPLENFALFYMSVNWKRLQLELKCCIFPVLVGLSQYMFYNLIREHVDTIKWGCRLSWESETFPERFRGPVVLRAIKFMR